MVADKTRIIDWLYRKEFAEGTLDFDELLLQATEQALEKPSLDASAYVYSNSIRLWNAVMQRTEVDVRRGVSPIFIISNRDARRVVWYPCSDMPTEAKKRRKLCLYRSRPALLRRIDTLGHREYEALGCVMARIAGASEISLTPRGNEGGIDFFAQIVLCGRTHIFSGTSACFRVVGQSKKYSEKVDVERVRGFLTTIQEVRDLSPSVKSLIPAWFLEGTGPLVGWMVAHSGFQSGAETKARHNGVLLSTSLDLAEGAAVSRLLSPFDRPNERADMLHQLVQELLQEYGD